MNDVILLRPDEGRRYDLGRLTAVFKADEAETGCGYSVSEWLLQPGQTGVGAHSHEANDEIFYVVSGCPSILVGETWTPCEPGTFLRIPAGVQHDFRNDGEEAAKLLNVFIPGGFERQMPAIVEWFAGSPDR